MKIRDLRENILVRISGDIPYNSGSLFLQKGDMNVSSPEIKEKGKKKRKVCL